jgi:transcriptional regulator with XRE-family HTH domain
MYPNLKLQLFRSSVRQNFLAREVGIDESILSKIIHGYREPSKEQRQLLANYLAVEETWLFEKFEIASPTRWAGNHGAPQKMKEDIT